jgi:hypothetical protein
MRQRLTTFAVSAACIAVGVVLISAAAMKPAAPAPPTHGKVAKGRVVAFDAKAHTMQVRSAAAMVPLVMTPATKVTGGTLKVGEFVDARYMAKDGKNMATSIAIVQPVTR